MNRPVVVGAVQLRLVEARLLYTALPVVGHDQAAGSLIEIKGTYMGTAPVPQVACPGGLGVGVTAGAQHSDKDIGLAHLAGFWVGHRHRLTGMIHEGLLA